MSKKEKKEIEYLSPGKFAKLVDVNLQSVHYAIKKGKLPTAVKNEDGRWQLDKEKCLEEWHKNRDQKAVAKGNKRKVKAEKAEVLPSKKLVFNDLSYADTELREKYYKAQMAELKYQEQAGKLIPVAEVDSAAFEMARKVRDAILSIPARIAPEIAVETDPHSVEMYLNRELVSALEGLTKGDKK
jgi:phage terminase Nu1 subunit (DNA packaging protein)